LSVAALSIMHVSRTFRYPFQFFKDFSIKTRWYILEQTPLRFDLVGSVEQVAHCHCCGVCLRAEMGVLWEECFGVSTSPPHRQHSNSTVTPLPPPQRTSYNPCHRFLAPCVHPPAASSPLPCPPTFPSNAPELFTTMAISRTSVPRLPLPPTPAHPKSFHRCLVFTQRSPSRSLRPPRCATVIPVCFPPPPCSPPSPLILRSN
jgi:hypothetical protein